jgi:hypothetical protein
VQANATRLRELSRAAHNEKTTFGYQLLRSRQILIAVIWQGRMRRQRAVWKLFLPTAPFFLAGIVRQVDGNIFLDATANRTSVPGTPELRHVRRFLPQVITCPALSFSNSPFILSMRISRSTSPCSSRVGSNADMGKSRFFAGRTRFPYRRTRLPFTKYPLLSRRSTPSN